MTLSVTKATNNFLRLFTYLEYSNSDFRNICYYLCCFRKLHSSGFFCDGQFLVWCMVLRMSYFVPGQRQAWVCLQQTTILGRIGWRPHFVTNRTDEQVLVQTFDFANEMWFKFLTRFRLRNNELLTVKTCYN